MLISTIGYMQIAVYPIVIYYISQTREITKYFPLLQIQFPSYSSPNPLNLMYRILFTYGHLTNHLPYDIVSFPGKMF